MLTKALLTSEDLERVQSATGKNYELIRGELFEVMPATPRHHQIAFQTGRLLKNWNDIAKAGVVGAGGYTLERRPDTVRGPDVSFISKGRMSRQQARRGFPELAPDLIVEVRSPNDTWAELVEKAEQFMGAGTRLALLVEPDEFVELRRPGRETQRLGLDDVFESPDVLPGFRCQVRDLFPEEYG